MSITSLTSHLVNIPLRTTQPHFIELDSEKSAFTLYELVHKEAVFDYCEGSIMLILTPREGNFGTFKLTVCATDDQGFYELRSHSLLEDAWSFKTIGELSSIAQAIVGELGLSKSELDITVDVALKVTTD